MHAYIKEFAPGVFEPEDVLILNHAFDDAWARVQVSKLPCAAEEYAEIARTTLAKHIICTAKVGERDPRWLADRAILYLARQKLSRA